jgi:hypothetical protein
MKAGTIGPCTGCGTPHERYGPDGRPHCSACFPGTAAHSRQAARHQAAPRPAPKAEPLPHQAEPDREPELSLF